MSFDKNQNVINTIEYRIECHIDFWTKEIDRYSSYEDKETRELCIKAKNQFLEIQEYLKMISNGECSVIG